MAAGLYRLHHTRLKPSYLALNIGPIDAVPRHAGRRTRPCCCTHLLSSRIDGSANSLVRRDHEEVCPLSRRVMLQPVSRPLQPGIRFFPVPVPAPPWADLAACCPRGERYGVSTFRLWKYVGLGACSGPGGIWVTKAESRNAVPPSGTVLVRAQ